MVRIHVIARSGSVVVIFWVVLQSMCFCISAVGGIVGGDLCYMVRLHVIARSGRAVAWLGGEVLGWIPVKLSWNLI